MKVLIIDNSVEITVRLKDFLLDIASIDSIDIAYSIHKARTLFVTIQPEVVIMDLHLTEGSSIDLIRFFDQQNPKPCIIVMSSYPYHDVRMHCLNAGAHYFLSKTDEFFQMTSIIKNLSDSLEMHADR